MGNALWLIPALPLLGFVVLALLGRHLGEQGVSVVGVGSVLLSFALVATATASLAPAAEPVASQVLWTWFEVGGLAPRIGLTLDPLSACWALVITGVGALIHLFATDYMRGDAGYARFFAYMNLFVSAMLVLVLADNLLLLYLGWEGVGLCSYLLIGFWYADPANGRAARKAFVVTRVGDAALALGLCLLATQLGTLQLPELFDAAAATWRSGEAMAVVAAFLLLGGAAGKSAQIPLQVWLPDAMAGPTPVSALIHAATMVTAGVYLVARTHPLFALAPSAMDAVAILGAATLLVAGLAALSQRDIKRILAYSTIGQIGYMFLALGVGAWTAAVFHFVTHALFKALLFLGAGSLILAMHHDNDIFRMGGLRGRLPVTFGTFLVASAALAGFPLVTSGFYSKDAILLGAMERSPWLWGIGLLGAFLTALYIFRAVFVVFTGPVRREPTRTPSTAARVALVTLAVGSVVAGALGLPGFLGSVLPVHHPEHVPLGEAGLAGIAAIASVAGIGIAWLLWGGSPAPERWRGWRAAQAIDRVQASGFGFDALYDAALVKPFVWLGRVNRDDVVDRVYTVLAAMADLGHDALSDTQTGRLRWYLGALAAGGAALLALALLGGPP